MASLPESRSFAVFRRLAGEWWNSPVDYAAQVQYFAKRSMAEAIRVLIGVGNGLTVVTSLAILLPWAGPDRLVSRIVVASFAVVVMFWVIRWCFRPWPSLPMSRAFVISCDIGIATLALYEPTWLSGLYGFNAFTQLSVYLLFFDGPRFLALHTLWIFASTAVFAMRAAAEAHFDGVVFAVSILVATTPVLAAPVGIQFGIRTLRNDANESVTDPLTGLLNRRGLHLHFAELLSDRHPSGRYLALMVADLDRFKDINDTFGHPIGDDVLIRTARRIESAVRANALVARIGGEEFVVIDVTEPDHTQRTAERVRCAIAASADHAPVTASIGVTHVELAIFTAPEADPMALLDTSLSRADQAMLDAKRKGGNTTVHVTPIDQDLESSDRYAAQRRTPDQ
ncbi:GGDEF domain-containing protein [Mycobacterium interjectum]|uniref:GGDEF domain-containing protein n=1 Tax=Mycobacterium interjectum TaxID=33895 RepID=UPI000AD0590E|nr:GGDEF domain-containing protein [Mycobacterium interjectum]